MWDFKNHCTSCSCKAGQGSYPSVSVHNSENVGQNQSRNPLNAFWVKFFAWSGHCAKIPHEEFKLINMVLAWLGLQIVTLLTQIHLETLVFLIEGINCNEFAKVWQFKVTRLSITWLPLSFPCIFVFFSILFTECQWQRQVLKKKQLWHMAFKINFSHIAKGEQDQVKACFSTHLYITVWPNEVCLPSQWHIWNLMQSKIILSLPAPISVCKSES